jgi:hypothetical protein
VLYQPAIRHPTLSKDSHGVSREECTPFM